MRLIKMDGLEYWVNDKGQLHGEYKAWHNGRLRRHCFFVNDRWHGEDKKWNNTGELFDHSYWSNDKIVRDLIQDPVGEEDKIKLTLEHGGQWICN